MRLQEYQAKRIFKEYGIPIPKGEVASNINEVVRITQTIDPPVIIKAQVLTKNRSRAGGIRLAKSLESANEISTEMFNMSIHGLPVEKILVEAALHIEEEFYLGITIDYAKQAPVLISAHVGGNRIEEIALSSPEDIFVSEINPLIGLRDYNIFAVLGGIELDRKHWKNFYELAHNLWHVFIEKDALLIEINPLVVTSDGYLIAVDGRMILDERAIHRHQDIDSNEAVVFLSDFQRQGLSYGLTIGEMDGQIGCLTNGRPLGMIVSEQFADVPENLAHCVVMEGATNEARVAMVLEMMMNQASVEVLMVNISSGFMRMDMVAEGILLFMEKTKSKLPVVVCIKGTNAEIAKKILKRNHIFVVESVDESVSKAISCLHFSESVGENEA